jgi:hypothetical protein
LEEETLRNIYDHSTLEIKRKGENPLVAHIFRNILYTAGIKITQVQQYYGNLLGHDEIPRVDLREFWVAFNDVVQNATYPIDLGSRAHRLFWLLVDRGETSFSSDDELNTVAFERVSSFFGYILNLLAADAPTLSSCTMDGLQNPLRDDGAQGSKENWWIFKFLMKVFFKQLDLLSPFISQTGSIGLAPPHTQPGDELWLIPTCKRPIVLRPHNRKHLVLGNAWFDDEKLWESCGGMCEFLTEGEEIGNYKVQAIWLE